MIGTFIGVLPFFNDGVAGTVEDIKPPGNTPTAGLLYFLQLLNKTNADAYLQLFNLPASGVTLGTTAPSIVYHLAANADLVIPMPMPLALGGTGISAAGTTGASNATGAAISVTAHYQ